MYLWACADILLEGGELAGVQDASPPYFLRSAQCRAGLGLLLSYLISNILQVISGELLSQTFDMMTLLLIYLPALLMPFQCLHGFLDFTSILADPCHSSAEN